jgi:hypothetical protein
MAKKPAEKKKKAEKPDAPRWTIREGVSPLQKKTLREILRAGDMSPVKIELMTEKAIGEHGKVDPQSGKVVLPFDQLLWIYDKFPWDFQIKAIQFGVVECEKMNQDEIEAEFDDSDILLMSSSVFMEVFQSAKLQKKRS